MSDSDEKPSRRPIHIFLAAFFLFAVCAVFGIWLTRTAGNVAVFWPANAALVWFGLVKGRHHLPQILLGSFLANAAVQLAFGDPLVLAIGLPLANTAEIALVLLALKKADLGVGSITDPARAQILLSILCATAIPSALIGAATLTMAFSGSFGSNFIQWWAGDVISQIFILMLILSPHRSAIRWDFRQWSASALIELVAGVALSGFSIFMLGALNMPPAIGMILPLLGAVRRMRTSLRLPHIVGF